MGKTGNRKSILAQYFLMIRTRDEILQEIAGKPERNDMFYRWNQHFFCHKSDTGLERDLLQEYVFIALDIFKKTMENKSADGELEARLTFLSFDEPERMGDLITRFPEFKTLYQEIYELCLNTERVMSMYSKELQEMDRDTTLYMLDELQAEVNRTADELAQISNELAKLRKEKQAVVGRQLYWRLFSFI